ncbi:glutamate receptor ionotropic kainate 3-like [Sarcoptes scabiei]|nr:glutamate receptor ionotropic kainate 3-like [Sarcoptes scabiei]
MHTIISLLLLIVSVVADWEFWWTYEGISGPDFWGRLNPRWSHCSKGQRQSPIDIDTSVILYDPHLSEIKIDGDNLKGELVNTGRGISLLIEKSFSNPSDKSVIFSGGPLSYQYTLSNITLHFGRENDRGSEHTIDGKRFPGELQLLAYNSQLYKDWSEAKRKPNGLAAIAIFIMISRASNPLKVSGSNEKYSLYSSQQQQHSNSGLKLITNFLKNITTRGLSHSIDFLSIFDLMPSSYKHYITYDGSLTQPACHETIRWIILNKPIYLSSHHFHMLRHLLKGDGHQDNYRPIQPRNRRLIRSNIIKESFAQKIRQSHKYAVENVYARKWKREIRHRQQSKNDRILSNEIRGSSNEQQFYKESQLKSIDSQQIDDSLNALRYLGAVKDIDSCSPNQIRLYGYRANDKIAYSEF